MKKYNGRGDEYKSEGYNGRNNYAEGIGYNTELKPYYIINHIYGTEGNSLKVGDHIN